MKRMAVDRLSAIFEPAYNSFCAALLVHHENTNPVKLIAQTWFCNRLLQIRKDEVRVMSGILSACSS